MMGRKRSILHAEQAILIERLAQWLHPGGWLLVNLGVLNDPGSIEPDWLGATMYWSRYDARTNLDLVTRADFTLVETETLIDDEDGEPVPFLWILAKKGASRIVKDKRRFSLNTQVEHVQAILSTTPERWQRLVSTLPIDLLTRPPAAGEWSALNCLQHLLDAERLNFPVRFRAFLTGQDFTPFDPNQQHEGPDTQTPEQLAAEFARARQASLALLVQVTDADLKRTAQHPQFGTVTLAEMLQTWAAHDLMHTVQAERALMQPFMLGCGPWRTFFRDHEIGVPKE